MVVYLLNIMLMALSIDWPTAIAILGIVIILALYIAARYFNVPISISELLAALKELLAILKKEDTPTPEPEPDDPIDPYVPPEPPTPPQPNWEGVEIKKADFFGRGEFTAAVIANPIVWKNGGGNIEVRTPRDDESLYDIVCVSTQGYYYWESQGRYRLEDNTVIALVADPFWDWEYMTPKKVEVKNAEFTAP